MTNFRFKFAIGARPCDAAMRSYIMEKKRKASIVRNLSFVSWRDHLEGKSPRILIDGPWSGIDHAPQTRTVTRKKAAGIRVPPSVLWFFAFASCTNWVWRSSVLPLFWAASTAFMVGP